jgi:hypothetical protein
VIDEICRKNFYVPTRVSYRRLERQELNDRFVYGPDPVIDVTVLFERYFFPEIYSDKMPNEVHARLGHPQGEGGGGGGAPAPRRPGGAGGAGRPGRAKRANAG